MQYFRLDSAVDNDALTQYYESQGFLPVGECEDGPYRGILRQKKLKKKNGGTDNEIEEHFDCCQRY